MKTELISLDRAKAMARVSSMSDEEEAAIRDILQTVTKNEGIKVTFEDGEKIATMKGRFEKVAKAEDMELVIRSTKGGMVIWAK